MKKIFLYLVFGAVCGYSQGIFTEFETLKGVNQNQLEIEEINLFSSEIYIYHFKKQNNIFAQECFIEDAEKGFSLYLTIQEDLQKYKKIEQSIRQERKKRELQLENEVQRLTEIYQKKFLPLERGINAWKNHNEEKEAQKEIQALNEKKNELESALQKEIQELRIQILPEERPKSFDLTLEEVAKEKVIEKYQLSRSSFSGTALSFQDVLLSTSTQSVAFNLVPLKNLDFLFEPYQQKNSERKNEALFEIRPNFKERGVEIVYDDSKRFYFSFKQFQSAMKLIEEKKNEIINVEDVQILSYQMGIQKITPESADLKQRKNMRDTITIPNEFFQKKGPLQIKLATVNKKPYVFLLPKKQEGSLAENICLIFTIEKFQRIKDSLETKTGTKIKKQISDFWDYQKDLNVEYFNIDKIEFFEKKWATKWFKG